MARHVITIPNWRPALQNEWTGRHWAVKARMKKADRETVAAYALAAGVPKAAGKRRVSLTAYLGKGQRRWDPDNTWKSLLDALVACGVLADDSDKWAELGPVAFVRLGRKDPGPPRCEIALEDVEGEG